MINSHVGMKNPLLSEASPDFKHPKTLREMEKRWEETIIKNDAMRDELCKDISQVHEFLRMALLPVPQCYKRFPYLPDQLDLKKIPEELHKKQRLMCESSSLHAALNKVLNIRGNFYNDEPEVVKEKFQKLLALIRSFAEENHLKINESLLSITKAFYSNKEDKLSLKKFLTKARENGHPLSSAFKEVQGTYHPSLRDSGEYRRHLQFREHIYKEDESISSNAEKFEVSASYYIENLDKENFGLIEQWMASPYTVEKHAHETIKEIEKFEEEFLKLLVQKIQCGTRDPDGFLKLFTRYLDSSSDIYARMKMARFTDAEILSVADFRINNLDVFSTDGHACRSEPAEAKFWLNRPAGVEYSLFELCLIHERDGTIPSGETLYRDLRRQHGAGDIAKWAEGQADNELSEPLRELADIARQPSAQNTNTTEVIDINAFSIEGNTTVIRRTGCLAEAPNSTEIQVDINELFAEDVPVLPIKQCNDLTTLQSVFETKKDLFKDLPPSDQEKYLSAGLKKLSKLPHDSAFGPAEAALFHLFDEWMLVNKTKEEETGQALMDEFFAVRHQHSYLKHPKYQTKASPPVHYGTIREELGKCSTFNLVSPQRRIEMVNHLLDLCKRMKFDQKQSLEDILQLIDSNGSDWAALVIEAGKTFPAITQLGVDFRPTPPVAAAGEDPLSRSMAAFKYMSAGIGNLTPQEKRDIAQQFLFVLATHCKDKFDNKDHILELVLNTPTPKGYENVWTEVRVLAFAYKSKPEAWVDQLEDLNVMIMKNA